MKIITFACDLYADVGPAYEYLWKEHWPNCPYEMVYVTNSKPLGVDGTVHYIPGKDIEYGRRLRKFVSRFCQEDELGLFMMIDYLPRAINVELVEQARKLCERDDVAHCRLRPMPHPKHRAPAYLKLNNDVWGMVEKGERYALSLQPGIWKPSDLARCTKDNWDPWATETQGSRLTKRLQGVLLCTRKPAILHHNYYRKRKPQGARIIRDNVPEELWPSSARKGSV